MGDHNHFRRVAEKLVHARPESEEEARAALEWIAAREGKALDELMKERSGGAGGGTAGGAAYG
jgi:hypothetical protein